MELLAGFYGEGKKSHSPTFLEGVTKKYGNFLGALQEFPKSNKDNEKNNYQQVFDSFGGKYVYIGKAFHDCASSLFLFLFFFFRRLNCPRRRFSQDRHPGHNPPEHPNFREDNAKGYHDFNPRGIVSFR